jgi:microcystin-dependent protein
MALIVKDRVQETSTTVGTGTLTLGGAVLGFQSFAAIGDGNTTYYAINDPITGDWEVGIGTYTSSGTTLSRTTVFESSNSGSLVNFSAGTKNVFCTYPAERAVYLDAAGSAVTLLDIGTLGVSTANITTANISSGTVSATPTNNTDIVNKQYADAIASGIHFHEAVAYATTAALPACTYNNGTSGVGATLTGDANGALTIDSYTFTSPADNGTRVLIKDQANGAHNGVYTLTQAGNSSPGAPFILTRATDFDTVGTGVDQIDEGDFFLVTSGVVNLNTAWVQQTAPPITIGTTAIVFQQFSAPITYTAGTGLNESPSYTFNIANTTVTAATYGSASQVPVFAVNAQGQLTTVTDTAISISSSAVSGLAASATTDTTDANNITSGSLGTSRLSGSYTGVTGVGTLTAGTWNATAIAANYGGTGITSYAVGDLLYADTTTTLAKLADVAVGNALISGGVSANPSWGKIGLATHVDGTLPVANGGMGATSLTANNVILGNGTSAVQFVAPGASGNVLTSDGTTWTSSASGGAFVTGMILLWSGSIASIPSGWALCNGTSGTPDLRDRFVVGAGNTYAVGATGGSTTRSLIEANLPSHTHTFSGTGTSSNASGTTTGAISFDFLSNFGCISNVPSASGAFSASTGRSNRPQGAAGTGSNTTLNLNVTAHTHSTTISGTTGGGSGTSTAFSILPPYYALAYIMKT